MSRLSRQGIINKKALSAFAITGIFIFSIICFLSNNTNFLLMVYSGLDKPSKAYNIVTEKIYKQLTNRDKGQEIINRIVEGRKPHLNSFLYYSLGIIGEKKATQFLIDSCSKYENKIDDYSIMHSIISSMGLIGDQRFLPIIKHYLDNYDKYEVLPTRYLMAQTIYLISGENYHYVDKFGEKSGITITSELRNARHVILETVNRRRSIDEMIILDKLDRPPEA